MTTPTFPLTGQPLEDLARQAINPAEFARITLKFEPDATQYAVLKSIPRRLILNCNRQWGKSTVSAIILAHRAIFQAGSLSIILGPSERQSAETLRKVAGFLRDAGVQLVSDKVNRHALVLAANHSRIVALPSTDAKVRGFSKVSLLVIDEASRVPDPLYLALRPALAVADGDIVLVSTPYGKRGFFYTEATSGKADWQRYTVPASQCPRIPKSFLEEERANYGEEHYAQEYECQFVEDGRFLFTDEDFTRLFKTDVEPLKIHDRNSPAWRIAMKSPGAPSTAPSHGWTGPGDVSRYAREE